MAESPGCPASQDLLNLMGPILAEKKDVEIQCDLIKTATLNEDLFTTNYDQSENKIPLTRIKQEPDNCENLVPGYPVDQSLLLPVLQELGDFELPSNVKHENKARLRKKKSKDSQKPKAKLRKKDKKGTLSINQMSHVTRTGLKSFVIATPTKGERRDIVP